MVGGVGRLAVRVAVHPCEFPMNRNLFALRLVRRFWLLGLSFVLGYLPAVAGDPDPMEVFNRRILPIFKSEKPSSCVQCHLASVDLKDYILPSAEKTFLSLRDQGLIDLDSPEDSKILQLIDMGSQDTDAGARLIHAKTRRAEYDAFAAWIRACARDERLRRLPPLPESERAGPRRADSVIRHARKSRVVDAFARTIWAQRLRCFPCHTPFEVDPENPRQAPARKTLRQLTERYGKEKVEQLGFFRETPEATLQRLIDMSRHSAEGDLPIINVRNPLESLLLLKPLAKLPPKDEEGRIGEASNRAPVSHGGGLKMHKNDASYKAFAAWLVDYAKTVRGEYRSVSELPADNWISTEYTVRLTSVQDKWKPLTPVQLVLYRWDDQKSAYADRPVAFTQSLITPRHLVNGTLFLFRDEPSVAKALSSGGMAELPLHGKFLVKVYVDRRGKLERDPWLLLGEEDFVGELELEVRRWRPGFKNARRLSAKPLED